MIMFTNLEKREIHLAMAGRRRSLEHDLAHAYAGTYNEQLVANINERIEALNRAADKLGVRL